MSHSEKEMIIIGLVHPQGSGGGSSGKLWSFVFKFYAWRNSDGELHKTILKIQGEVSHEKLRFLMERIQEFKIIKIRIKLKDRFTAEFLDLIDDSPEADHDLSQIAFELSQPLTYEHPRFGTFIFDRSMDFWEIQVDWAGKLIKLIVFGDENSPEEELLKTAIALWDHQLSWNERVLDYAVQEKLPLKNDFWLEGDELPVSPDEFKSRISLRSIMIFKNDDFSFDYKDGDLFFGHSIIVEGNLQDGLTRANI